MTSETAYHPGDLPSINLIADADGNFSFNQPVTRSEFIRAALDVLGRDIKRDSVLNSPESVRAYLRLALAREEREVFAVLFLDNRHRVIAFERLFYGTIDGASVHPREVVKAALKVNAAAVIFAHNHPSGVAEPSHADRAITIRLRDALALVDVRALDHIVVGAEDSVSMAERGLL